MAAVSTGVDNLPHSRRVAAWVCVGVLLALVCTLALPRFSWLQHGSAEMAVTHLLLEMFSVVVSVLVVVIAWHAFADDERRVANTWIAGFTVVAGMDMLHAFSYEGMPAFGSPASTSKAIFFWFMGRGVELLAVWVVALGVRLPGARWLWQVGGLLVILGLGAVGTWRLDWFPATFVPGQGVTPFKAYVEWLLCLGNLGAALWFWRLSRRSDGQPRQVYFAAACFVMGLGELTFTSYVDTGDFIIILGHVFKVVAYGLIYAGTFWHGLHEPYEQLQRSEQALQRKQTELDAVLRQVPAGLARLDREGRYLYVNEAMARWLGRPAAEIIGQRFEEIVSPERRCYVSYHWALAMAGQASGYEGQVLAEDGQPRRSSVWIAPERDERGQIVGAVAASIDTTAQHQLQEQLRRSLDEVRDLRTALDAHAIVAVTDARGVIVSVNDKFCEISQYRREELLGQTHRVVNSGHHPVSFFQDLWRTIAAGRVWSGEVCNRAKDGSLYWVNTTIVPYQDEQGRPLRYVAIRADITERKRMELQVEAMAYHDVLTGLPNRRLFMDRLQQALVGAARSQQHGALLFLDLDHFKEINDTLGHEQGDQLLQQVARRLQARVRQTDTVARLGGDEFVVVLPDLGASELEATTQAGLLGEEILRDLSSDYVLSAGQVRSTPSIGVVMFCGAGMAADDLLKQADIALYQAKDAGRSTLCFFDPQIQQAFAQRLELEADLRQALLRQELRLYYQPVVDAKRHTVGMEALLRWQHPSRGLVAPGEFVPLAEKSGLIVPIGLWVIEEACRQLALWRTDAQRSQWQLAVNVSARQFRQPDFVDRVVALLDRWEIASGQLKLEITESLLQENLQETVQRMKQLRARGVRFAIDDFGTGYSSLSYIKELPVHVLKIDRSFVARIDRDESDAAIARTVLGLAQHLGLDVVAEGVETEAQFRALLAYGCPLFQGYLFGRPAPLAPAEVAA